MEGRCCDRVLIMLAKYPEPGLVKTRLCPPLTQEEAAWVHEACVGRSIKRFGELAEVSFQLAVAPDDRLAAFQKKFSVIGSPIVPQGDGDLGARLTGLAERAFDEGALRVVLVGSDSPTLPLHYLLSGFEQLTACDVTLGPCEDGGYYLLGMSRFEARLFDGIPWGTASVAEETMKRAEACGLSVERLPEWYDIDRAEDLTRAVVDLRPGSSSQGCALLDLLIELGFGGEPVG